ERAQRQPRLWRIGPHPGGGRAQEPHRLRRAGRGRDGGASVSDRSPLLVIVGPTAVGKTAFCVLLGQRLKAEIVSADSMQVYRGMDIGTAKPSEAERGGVPHHCLDLVDPKQAFNVAD